MVIAIVRHVVFECYCIAYHVTGLKRESTFLFFDHRHIFDSRHVSKFLFIFLKTDETFVDKVAKTPGFIQPPSLATETSDGRNEMKITDNYNLIAINFNFSRPWWSARFGYVLACCRRTRNGCSNGFDFFCSARPNWQSLARSVTERNLQSQRCVRPTDHENWTYPPSLRGDVPKKV